MGKLYSRESLSREERSTPFDILSPFRPAAHILWMMQLLFVSFIYGASDADQRKKLEIQKRVAKVRHTKKNYDGGIAI